MALKTRLKLIFSGHILLDEKLNKFKSNKMFFRLMKKKAIKNCGLSLAPQYVIFSGSGF